jgi:hypothetical protein
MAHPGGRPPRFKNAAEIENIVLEYFSACRSENRPLTITGLIMALGFNSRQSFYDYEAKPEFVDTIKKARLYVENSYEERLHTAQPTGAIFALKNFGWRDKQETELTGPGGSPLSIEVHFVKAQD